MDECHVNSYYSLIWSSDILSKRKMKIKGEKITRQTVLPRNSQMLYATNKNDVAKITKVNVWKEVEYDPATTKQSVRFWKDTDEYTLTRDICIVVWEGESTLSLPNDNYKIVSPEVFEYIVKESPTNDECETIDWSSRLNEIQSTLVNILNNVYENKKVEESNSISKNKSGKLSMLLMVN